MPKQAVLLDDTGQTYTLDNQVLARPHSGPSRESAPGSNESDLTTPDLGSVGLPEERAQPRRTSPAEHMARDQALAEMAEQHQVAVIRFYRWDEPSLSLGYFQKESQRPKQFESLPIVRRSTGGGAIIHDCELTYSVMMPTDQSKGHINELYETVHKSIIGWLRDLGLPAEFVRDQKAEGMACECDPNSFLCFDRRADNDVVIRQSKILGSAQRRIGSTILQHGSLLMQASRETPHLKGLVDLLGTSLASEGEIEFANQNSETTGQRDRELSVLATKTIAEAVCADFGISEIHATEWSTDSAARTIAESRFANPEWTSRR